MPTEQTSIEIRHDHEKAVVRRLLTLNPSISLLALEKRLSELPEPVLIERHRLSGVVKEIRADRTREVEEETKIDMYAKMADITEFCIQQLRAIAQEEKLVYTATDENGKPKHGAESRIFAQNNRIKALVEIMKAHERLFNLKMDLGIIERKLGTADVRVIELLAYIKNERDNGNASARELGVGAEAKAS